MKYRNYKEAVNDTRSLGRICLSCIMCILILAGGFCPPNILIFIGSNSSWIMAIIVLCYSLLIIPLEVRKRWPQQVRGWYFYRRGMDLVIMMLLLYPPSNTRDGFGIVLSAVCALLFVVGQFRYYGYPPTFRRFYLWI